MSASVSFKSSETLWRSHFNGVHHHIDRPFIVIKLPIKCYPRLCWFNARTHHMQLIIEKRLNTRTQKPFQRQCVLGFSIWKFFILCVKGALRLFICYIYTTHRFNVHRHLAEMQFYTQFTVIYSDIINIVIRFSSFALNVDSLLFFVWALFRSLSLSSHLHYVCWTSKHILARRFTIIFREKSIEWHSFYRINGFQPSFLMDFPGSGVCINVR